MGIFLNLRQLGTALYRFTLRAETFACRNFYVFRDFDSFLRKFLSGKKLKPERRERFFCEKSTFFALISLFVKSFPGLQALATKNGTI